MGVILDEVASRSEDETRIRATGQRALKKKKNVPGCKVWTEVEYIFFVLLGFARSLSLLYLFLLYNKFIVLVSYWCFISDSLEHK